MADFQSDFDQATKTIDDTITTQVSSSFSWRNVPGSLTKTSVSSGGYVWGFNSSSMVYVCQLPCSGNWIVVQVPALQTVIDITTDESTVYILGNASNGTLMMFSSSIANQGPWTSVSVPFAATKLFSTHTYIWAQDSSNNKQKCAKPCMAGNWIAVTDKTVSITSSSDTTLYGLDPTGVAMQTDELMQSAWKPVSGFAKTNLTTINGNIDQDALFGVDTASNLLKCAGDCTEPEPVDTSGFTPSTISAEPHSLWMTSTTSGAVGNIFTRSTTSNYTDIMNAIHPLDEQRDSIVKQVQTDFSNQTETLTLSKQVDQVVQFLSGLFKKTGSDAESLKSQSGELKNKIFNAQTQIDSFTAQERFLQVIIITLVIASSVYLLTPIIGSLVHLLALIVLVAGLLYAINFS